MTRLKKKAWESIELYHHTSSQSFMKMMEEGAITPGGYNGNTAGGGHEKIYDVSNKDNSTNNIYYPLVLLDGWINDGGVNITKKLIDLVNQKKEENPDGWQDEEIEINVSLPSGNEIGVYLTNNQLDEFNYSGSALNNSEDKDSFNFKATLKIKVQTDALSPDYDDLDYFEVELSGDESTPLWKQSLDAIGQCTHNGPIDVNDIVSVTFFNVIEPPNVNSKFDYDVDKFKEFAGKFIQEDVAMSAKEAYNNLISLKEEYMSIENTVVTSKKIKRLRK